VLAVVSLSPRSAWVLSACGESPKTPAVEDLLGPLDQAKRDSALAGAAAAAAGNPPQSPPR